MSETHDAQGREVFTVHPEILAGGAAYRSLKDTSANQAPKARRDNTTRQDQAPTPTTT